MCKPLGSCANVVAWEVVQRLWLDIGNSKIGDESNVKHDCKAGDDCTMAALKIQMVGQVLGQLCKCCSFARLGTLALAAANRSKVECGC